MNKNELRVHPVGALVKSSRLTQASAVGVYPGLLLVTKPPRFRHDPYQRAYSFARHKTVTIAIRHYLSVHGEAEEKGQRGHE